MLSYDPHAPSNYKLVAYSPWQVQFSYCRHLPASRGGCSHVSARVRTRTSRRVLIQISPLGFCCPIAFPEHYCPAIHTHTLALTSPHPHGRMAGARLALGSGTVNSSSNPVQSTPMRRREGGDTHSPAPTFSYPQSHPHILALSAYAHRPLWSDTLTLPRSHARTHPHPTRLRNYESKRKAGCF